MSVILTNPGRRPFVATLEHDVACAHDGVCHCTVTHRAGPDGKPEVIRFPQTIRVDGGKSLEIFSSALLVPTVARALKEGKLLKKVVRKAEEKAAPAVAPTPSKKVKK